MIRPAARPANGADRNPTAAPAVQEAACDVVVVGAGPAGSVTALLLARAGHEVLLLDRRPFPRPKPCGDCLSPEAARVLDRLGLLSAVQAERSARLEGWRITSATGAAFTGGFEAASDGDPLVRSAIAIERERLDAVLLTAARDAGARTVTGIRVDTLLRDRRGAVHGVAGTDAHGRPLRFYARLVVGADGLRSVVARRLGLLRRTPRLRKLSLTAHVRGVSGLGPLGELHLADGLCAGLAPVEDPAGPRDAPPLANITLVADAARFGRLVAADPTAFFRGALKRFPALAGRCQAIMIQDHAAPGVGPRTAPSDPRPAPFLASGPFDWPTRDIVADGAALVGDAAGYFDPFTGQGVFQALAGAEFLAEEADAALRAGRPTAHRLRRYARRLRRLTGEARALQRLIEFVIARPRFADFAVRRLAAAPETADALIAAAGDLRPARGLLSPALAFSLLTHSTPPEALR